MILIVSQADEAAFVLEQVASISKHHGATPDTRYQTVVSLMNGRDLHLSLTFEEIFDQIQAAVLAVGGVDFG